MRVHLILILVLLAGCGDGLAWRLPDPAVRIIAFGDSATRGPAERDYIDFLPELTGLSRRSFANEGSSGETIAEGVARLRTILDGGYYPNATTLIYWEGGNDLIDCIQQRDPLLALPANAIVHPFRQEFIAELDAIEGSIVDAVELGHSAGLRVFVVSYFHLPPQSDDCRPLLLGVLLPPQSAVANGYVRMLNERIASAADRAGVTLIDVESLSSTLREDADYYYNCTHLSEKGNELVARLISETIQDSTGTQAE